MTDKATKTFSVVIEGDTDSVWPPVTFDDYISALRHAIRVANSWKGVNGAPRIRIDGASYCEPLDVDTLLTMEMLIGAAGY
jgi:hypothetical protein